MVADGPALLGYRAFLPAALAFRQRARAMAAILALVAADMRRLGAGLAGLPARNLAQRAFWAARIRASPAGLMWYVWVRPAVLDVPVWARILWSSDSRDSMRSFMSAALLRSDALRFMRGECYRDG